MKKAIILMAAILTLFVTGCTSQKDRENAFVVASKSYYEKYMSKVTGLNDAEITISALKNAVKQNNDTYDMKLFKDCDANSKVVFTLKNGSINKTKVTLNCK